MTDTLEVQVGQRLRSLKATVATAESCTGGLIGHLLTEVPGSSAYVMGGIISYSNEVKQQQLGVKTETLQQFGAVSEQTAREMAEGVRARLGVDYGVSVTGIAGPGGDTPGKPVGLTYIGVAGPNGVTIQRHVWNGSRSENKRASADAALRLLLSVLESA